MNRRGLSRALAVIGILSSVAAVVPATASAATTATVATARSAAPGRPASTTPAVSAQAVSAQAVSQLAAWAALAGLGESSGPLTVPSMLAASAGAAARPAPALSAITGVVRGGDRVALTGACVTASGDGRTVSVMTGTGGRYVLPGLRPGGYTVSYQDCARPARYFEQWSGGADLAANAARVLVRAGTPTRLAPVTLRLTSPAAARSLARRSVLTTSRDDTVSGVVRSRSGHALANICVSALMSSRNSGEDVGDSTGRRGRYALPIGSTGKWLISFGSGCGNHGNYAPQWWRYASTPRKATRLHARPGRRFRGIDASLRPGAEISGVVRSERSGQPLGHVCVVATGLGPMSSVLAEVTTRANGSYLIDDLGTGQYQVRFDPFCGPAGNYLSASYPRPVAVTDGKTTTGINGHLAAGGAISGVVTSQATTAPLARICVMVTDGSTEAYVTTGQAGRYSFRHLRPGRYSVTFAGGCGNSGSYAPQFYDGQPNAQGATPVALAPGQARTGIDAAMLPGATVTGRVATSAATGLPGVCVALISSNYAGGVGQNPLADRNLVLDLPALPTAVTGRGGRYHLSNLMAGRYSIEFTGGCGHGTARYGSQVFTPQGHGAANWVWAGAGAVTAGVNVTLRPGGSITGVVTGLRGRRLSGVCAVAIDPATQGPLDLMASPAFSRRGVYRITGLAAGHYAVEFVPCSGQPYAEQWYRRQSSQPAATLVPVRTGRLTTGINAAMTSGGTLTGRIVSGRTGRSAGPVCVLVTGQAGRIVAGSGTAGTGRYRIIDVPPGRWNLEATPCLGRSPLAGITDHGVRVREGATHAVATIRLPQAGRLAGTVVGGTPATGQAGICVEATPITGDGTIAAGVTGRGGHYTLGGLAPGRYRVLFTPECLVGTAALTPQWFGGQPSAERATPVPVRAGRTTLSIGARLAADGGIAGTVSTGASADGRGKTGR
ncbi:MAG: carboxypeptidase regulatory-like domain-containing protein [Streptosporangiaceae bacterium]